MEMREDTMNCPVATLKKTIRKVHIPTQLPPSPKGHRWLGILPGRRDWVRSFGDVLREAGDVAYCRYVGFPACVVGHPDQIADVLVVNAASYTKSNMLRMLLGDGLATSEGELWRRQRNLLLPLFSRERLPEYGPIITRHIDRMMSTWKTDGIHDIYRDMMRLTLDVAAESFLGTQLNGRQGARCWRTWESCWMSSLRRPISASWCRCGYRRAAIAPFAGR
jgi:cytochrome P450